MKNENQNKKPACGTGSVGRGDKNMVCFIIVILSALLILALLKCAKWKITSFVFTIFVTEKYREPTEEKIRYYAQVIARKILHVK